VTGSRIGFHRLTRVGQAAFDHRVLASVCFFATDIHSATLGKGKNDDTLARVRSGDLSGKGELVVCVIITLLSGRQTLTPSSR
jgi:carboxymethylenebutenolidase